MERVKSLDALLREPASMSGGHSMPGSASVSGFFHQATIDLNVVLCHACGEKNVFEAPAPCAMIGAKSVRKNVARPAKDTRFTAQARP
jgi:hypothetical protein